MLQKLKHVLEAQQFDLELLKQIFNLANQMRVDASSFQINQILATIFYEPSTRTRLSFETAMLKLGGKVISTEKAKEFSSFTKGETLEDSIKVISNYADIIALRHFEIGAAKQASVVSSVPLINAGDGAGQHPTQSLLDLYTIENHFPQNIEHLTISLVGDLKYGRTVRSLCYLLSHYKKIKLIFVAPKICEMAWDIKSFLDKLNISWKETPNFNEAMSESDVIYMTRVQKERFLDMDRYKEACNIYKLDEHNIHCLPKHAIVLHPLPRLDEISATLDTDPRMVYFEQAKNGIWVRMALIYILLNNTLS